MDLRDKLFSWRSYTPLPFVALMLIFARPTGTSLLIGGAVALIGEAMRFWGVAYAGSLTRVTGSVGAPALVVAGPFARVRNPLYIGNILLYVGVGIMSQALWPWLPVLAFGWFVFQYQMIVSREEEFLAAAFGDAYAEYRANVPRFVLRPTPWQHPSQAAQHPSWSDGARSERRTFEAIALVMLILAAVWFWS
ncbi:MAG: isoprenylcysteine carboxylmethyltransferase family protein [Bacteroidetes bacterium]|jgi:protein-S-isoprenylcysteine O-methyltransferase Ste14|nr:isoprenylcysteine carboxylmethyltransferase family protein [Bacteroidota bacterium]